MATMRPAHPMPRPPHGSRVLLFALAACSASAAACPSPCAPVDARPPAEICADATQPPEPVIAACTAAGRGPVRGVPGVRKSPDPRSRFACSARARRIDLRRAPPL